MVVTRGGSVRWAWLAEPEFRNVTWWVEFLVRGPPALFIFMRWACVRPGFALSSEGVGELSGVRSRHVFHPGTAGDRRGGEWAWWGGHRKLLTTPCVLCVCVCERESGELQSQHGDLLIPGGTGHT